MHQGVLGVDRGLARREAKDARVPQSQEGGRKGGQGGGQVGAQGRAN